MKKKVVIDFESYYDDEISVVLQGNDNYVRDADAYIVAVAIDDEISCGTIAEMTPLLRNLADDTAVEFWAANSNFDRAWFDKYWGQSEGEWKCLLDLGAYNQLPRNLAGLNKAARGIVMDKSMRDKMKGVHYENLSPVEQEEVQQYCIGDVRESAELLAVLPPMSSTEDKIAEYTRMANRRGVSVNMDLVDSDKTKLEQMRFDSFKAIPWSQDAKPLSYPQLAKWCNTQGIPVPKSTAKTDEECADLMSEHPALNTVLSTMRRFRKANTMLEKLRSLKLRTTDDNILPLDFLYCGAPHTRRWSSRGVNVQNLDKEPLDCGNGTSIWTRNWITPRPGKIFLIRDYAQIEPRCLQWLAGNDDLLEAMRNGFSYYEAYARVARNWKGAPGTIKAEYGKAKYTLLKNECLGLGYGMGVPRFIEYARQNGMEITPAEAKPIVDGFRKNNPKVTAFWQKLDNLIRSTARDKAKHFAMEMPSGDTLQYFNIRASKGGHEGFVIKGDFGRQSRKTHLWGGLLTENFCQRMSRDLLAEAVLNLEAAGLPVLFTTHDEVILEVDDDNSKEEAAIEADRILSQAPEWAAGLPLQVEGDWATAYTK